MLDGLQVEITCLNEIKADTRSPTMRYDIYKTIKHEDNHTKINMNLSHYTPRTRDSYFKPGRTMIAVRGSISGRTVEVESQLKGNTLCHCSPCT